MAQEEILQFLRTNPKVKFSAKQLRDRFNQNKSLYVNLKKIQEDIDMGFLDDYHYDWVHWRGRGQLNCRVFWYEA